MRRMNRDGMALRGVTVVALFLVLLAVGWVLVDFASGLLSAIAISTGVGVAIFAGTRRSCAPGFIRRRER
jgi:phosphotransferase system  glucose/maltose/N-acetylglucosamine-specific IIC component